MTRLGLIMGRLCQVGAVAGGLNRETGKGTCPGQADRDMWFR